MFTPPCPVALLSAFAVQRPSTVALRDVLGFRGRGPGELDHCGPFPLSSLGLREQVLVIGASYERLFFPFVHAVSNLCECSGFAS